MTPDDGGKDYLKPCCKNYRKSTITDRHCKGLCVKCYVEVDFFCKAGCVPEHIWNGMNKMCSRCYSIYEQ